VPSPPLQPSPWPPHPLENSTIPETAAETQAVGSVWDTLKEKLFGTKEPGITVYPSNPSKEYPDNTDVEVSRQYDLSYGDPAASFIEPGKASTKKIPLREVPKWVNEDIKTALKDTPVDQDTADSFHRAWLGSRKSAIIALGFDPGKTALSERSPFGLTVAGLYMPDTDQMWADRNMEATILHESAHRGIRMLRANGKIPEFPNASFQRPDGRWSPMSGDEVMVRLLMHEHFPHTEKNYGPLSKAQVERAVELAKNYPRQYNLQVIENIAAEFRAKKRPGGPR
jgi:hypothetical protein